jgi:hypothetical protein
VADQRKAFEPIDHVLVVIGNDNLHRVVLKAKRRGCA